MIILIFVDVEKNVNHFITFDKSSDPLEEYDNEKLHIYLNNKVIYINLIGIHSIKM